MVQSVSRYRVVIIILLSLSQYLFLPAVKCSRLENIRLINSMVQTQLSLLWELPKDMVEYRMWLLYWIRVVRVTDGVSVLIKVKLC